MAFLKNKRILATFFLSFDNTNYSPKEFPSVLKPTAMLTNPPKSLGMKCFFCELEIWSPFFPDECNLMVVFKKQNKYATHGSLNNDAAVN